MRWKRAWQTCEMERKQVFLRNNLCKERLEGQRGTSSLLNVVSSMMTRNESVYKPGETVSIQTFFFFNSSRAETVRANSKRAKLQYDYYKAKLGIGT